LQVKDNYRKYNRLGRCMGHSAFVTQLDWSADSQFLQSNSVDHEVLYWTAAVCRPLRDLEAVRDIEWATADCPLTWGSLGLWGGEAGPDGPAAAVVSAARCSDLLAAGDGAGRIRLYASPACQPKSLHHTYSGHGAAVTRLAWLADSHKLISAGGKDTAILQWNSV
jgi:microtubule-associated protein-like 1/2